MKRLVVRMVQAMLLAFLLVLAGGLIMAHLTGTRLYSVQTSSMVPVFRPHDALVIRPVRPTDIKPGMVITYQASRGGALVSHRVVSVDQADNRFVTRGDALSSPDVPIISQQIIGRVNRTVPKMGYVLENLRTPLGLGLLVYLPVAVIFAREYQRLMRHYRARTYRLYGAGML